MEQDALDQSFALGKWNLCAPFRQLMYQCRSIGTLRHYGRKVVAFAMPRHLFDLFEMCDDYSVAAFVFVAFGCCPLDGRFDALIVCKVETMFLLAISLGESTTTIHSPSPSIFGASTRMSSVFFTSILSPTFGFRRINLCPLATAISEILPFGHHATLRTISPVSMVLMHRPVQISQTAKEERKKSFYEMDMRPRHSLTFNRMIIRSGHDVFAMRFNRYGSNHVRVSGVNDAFNRWEWLQVFR